MVTLLLHESLSFNGLWGGQVCHSEEEIWGSKCLGDLTLAWNPGLWPQGEPSSVHCTRASSLQLQSTFNKAIGLLLFADTKLVVCPSQSSVCLVKRVHEYAGASGRWWGARTWDFRQTVIIILSTGRSDFCSAHTYWVSAVCPVLAWPWRPSWSLKLEFLKEEKHEIMAI